MTSPVLLTKLSKFNNTDFELFNMYCNATSKSFETVADEFNTCIDNIKYLTEKQYDFSWITENAKVFEVNRRDFKNLCDDVCMLLGNRLEELCKYSRTPVIVKPSKYDDYCPMNSEDLVVYGNYREGERFSYDGKRYAIVDTKLESCPYYNIYCNSFEEDI